MGTGSQAQKVSIECVETASVYVHTDVTAVLPWVVHALFAGGLDVISDQFQTIHEVFTTLGFGRMVLDAEPHTHHGDTEDTE